MVNGGDGGSLRLAVDRVQLKHILVCTIVMVITSGLSQRNYY